MYYRARSASSWQLYIRIGTDLCPKPITDVAYLPPCPESKFLENGSSVEKVEFFAATDKNYLDFPEKIQPVLEYKKDVLLCGETAKRVDYNDILPRY